MSDETHLRIPRRGVLQLTGATGILTAGVPVGAYGYGDDENGDTRNEEDLPSLDEAPRGEPIDADDIQALIGVFDDEPTNAAQREIEGEMRNYTPRHLWKWVSEETLIALHLDDPNPEAATVIDYVVVGVKGAFTEEDKPGPEFSHFHQREADSWEGGHGGETGSEGYWLTHIAAREIEYPFHDEPISPRVDYGFMPTEPEAGSEGTTTFEVGGEGALSSEDRDALLEIFTDEVTNEDQREVEGEIQRYTPSHAWKWLTEDSLMFLHFAEPNPEDTEELIYFGIGTRGQFRAEDRPEGPPETDEEDFTHFHKWEADSWEAGHGAQSEDQWGYWLVHHAVRPLEMEWGDVDVGVDRGFMPTPLPEDENGEDDVNVDDTDDADDADDDREAEFLDMTGEDTVEIETRGGDEAADEPDFVFNPDMVRVDEGTTIRWVNTDGVFHTVTATDSLDDRSPSGEFDETISNEGDTFEWEAEETGTQYYYCQPHVGFMYGAIDIV